MISASAGVVAIDRVGCRWTRKHSGALDEFERVNCAARCWYLDTGLRDDSFTSESRSNATNKKNEMSEQRDARFPSFKALTAMPYRVSSTLSPDQLETVGKCRLIASCRGAPSICNTRQPVDQQMAV